MGCPVILTSRDDNTDDDLAEEHAYASGEKQRSASNSVDDQDSRDRDSHVDNTNDAGGKQAGSVSSQAKVSEDD